MRKGGAWLVLVAMLCCLSRAARAAEVSVNPVRVHLSKAAPSQSLSLQNTGIAAARFQITTYAWQQSAAGEMELMPTEDLAVFPTLLEIQPGKARRVRISARGTTPVNEQTYRIYIEELPPLNRQHAPAIQMLTRLGIPIFLQPDAPFATPQLSVDTRNRKLVLWLENLGNSYFVTESVEVVGTSGSGATLFQQKFPGWYVLAGGRRWYEVDVPSAACPDLSRIAAVTTTDHGEARAERSVAGFCASP